MRTTRLLFIVIFCSLFVTRGWSQIEKGLTYTLETGATFSQGNHTPFWLVANRYGLSSVERNNAYLSAGIFRQAEKNKKLTYGFGLEMAGVHRFTSHYVVQQAYADLRYHFLELSVGAKERGSELKNDELSTGGMILSANARPVPQFRLSIPEYIPVPGTRQWLHMRGHVAYGYFTDDRFKKEVAEGYSKYDRNTFYHSKAGFLKLEHADMPIAIEAGMEMVAQFGGRCYYPDGTVLDTPNDVLDFIRILFPTSGGDKASASDQINILGNHLGSYHLALAYRYRDWRFRAYYEHNFDDGSGMSLVYGLWKDCITGLEITFPKNPYITSFVGEFLYTKHQSGSFHYFGETVPGVPGTFTGADNYYNNGQFGGWEHWGQGMGNPLLISPIYNENHDLSFQSNRVVAYHIGVKSNPTPELACRGLLTLARHWGTYSAPFREIKNNKNVMLELTYSPLRLKGWHFSLAGAMDGGDLIGRSSGGMLTIRKEGLLGGKKE